MSTLQTSYMDWDDLIQHLKPGDLIEFDREILAGAIRYKHWAVYWGTKGGEHFVIHYTLERKAVIKMETLKAAAEDTKCRKNNECDKEWKPLPVDTILARAQEMLDTQKYNLVENNCEHFSNYCRYGEASSYQVDRAAAMYFSPVATVLGDKQTVRVVSKVAKGYYSYLTFSPVLAAYRYLSGRNNES